MPRKTQQTINLKSLLLLPLVAFASLLSVTDARSSVTINNQGTTERNYNIDKSLGPDYLALCPKGSSLASANPKLVLLEAHTKEHAVSHQRVLQQLDFNAKIRKKSKGLILREGYKKGKKAPCTLRRVKLPARRCEGYDNYDENQLIVKVRDVVVAPICKTIASRFKKSPKAFRRTALSLRDSLPSACTAMNQSQKFNINPDAVKQTVSTLNQLIKASQAGTRIRPKLLRLELSNTLINFVNALTQQARTETIYELMAESKEIANFFIAYTSFLKGRSLSFSQAKTSLGDIQRDIYAVANPNREQRIAEGNDSLINTLRRKSHLQEPVAAIIGAAHLFSASHLSYHTDQVSRAALIEDLKTRHDPESAREALKDELHEQGFCMVMYHPRA